MGGDFSPPLKRKLNILEVQNIYKSFRSLFSKVLILKDISFSLNRNEIFGFLGPNGAGKTTTIKIIVGLLNPDKGKVKILGGCPKDENIRKRIGFLPEQPYFYEHLTGEEFLDYTGRLYDIPKKERNERIKYLLERVGLYKDRKKMIRTYSRGMLQRLGIANALISDPEILILDEPLSGLDPIGRKEIKDLIYEQKKNGKAIFFSSHILPDVEEICDKIGIISSGKILKIGSLNEILKGEIKGVLITVRNLNFEKINDLIFEKRGNEYILRVLQNEVEDVLKKLLSFENVKIVSVKEEFFSLEEIFLKITKEENEKGIYTC